MNNIRITKLFNFEMAHALMGYDGPCKQVHGHSYQLSVTIIGKPIIKQKSAKLGMVMDFGQLKILVKDLIVDKYDHALVLNSAMKNAEGLKSKELFDKVIFVDYQPTSENLVIDFAVQIKERLPANLKLQSVKLRETNSSYAEWYASDNED